MTTVQQDTRDLYQRYDYTLIKYRGIVYYCRVAENYEGQLAFRLTTVDGHDEQYVDPYDSNINIKSVSLGYVNTESGCVYVKRSPSRQWRQGVPIFTLEEYLGDNANTVMCDCMLNNIYLSVNEALNCILDWGFKEIAIARNVKFSLDLSGKVFVYFQDKYIGEIPNPREDMTILLSDEKLAWAVRAHLGNIKWKMMYE